ncbi:Protease, insulinase family/protease, insulinase family protein [Enhygromyxa salina]|uniref:Protease, insulinase family/protease, insulinase family protein n=2 Tax=Enhygromyxa salina TaxID=215803 RepID=A0A0C2D767_9BACT|nr:Protease, insulinase family/protease, insulinase family protein [Enhygromyxa salina]
MAAALLLPGCKVDGTTVVVDTQDQAPTDPPPARANHSVELPVPADPSVTYAAWFQVGSQDDPVGREGLAWLTGELLAGGGTKSHPWQQIVELLFPMAASWRVGVDREMTTISGRSHHETADAFAALLTQQWTEPAFDPQDFERLRSEGLSYLQKNLRYASDEELGKAGLEWLTFQGTRYAHPSVGTVAGLQAITLDDVKAFYAAHYTRDRVVFAIGGRYQQPQLDALEASGQALPETASASPMPAPVPAPLEGKRLLIIDKPGADASISFGHPIDVHRGEPDFYALWLANSWLGEHRNSSSHLFQVIREARGLNYGDYSYIEAFPNGGQRQMPPTNVARRAQLFQVWIRTLPNEHAHFALRAAHRELELFVEHGLTQAQFELTRDFLRKYMLHFADTTSQRLGYAIDDQFYGLDGPDGQGHLDRFAAALDSMTLEQVNAAIREHIDPSNLAIVIVTGEAQQLREAIVADQPATISYPSTKPPEVLAQDELIGAHTLGISADRVTVIPVDEMFEN